MTCPEAPPDEMSVDVPGPPATMEIPETHVVTVRLDDVTSDPVPSGIIVPLPEGPFNEVPVAGEVYRIAFRRRVHVADVQRVAGNRGHAGNLRSDVPVRVP